jgi:hypothetical protein
MKTSTTNLINTSGQIVLSAKNDDALVIMECNVSDAYVMNEQTNNQYHFFTIAGQTFRYAYYNIEGAMKIYYTPIAGYDSFLIIPNVKKGNVYHVINAVNNTIVIEPFAYNLVGL